MGVASGRMDGRCLRWSGGRMSGSFVGEREDQWGQGSVRVGRATACIGRAREKAKSLGSGGGSGDVGWGISGDRSRGHGLG